MWHPVHISEKPHCFDQDKITRGLKVAKGGKLGGI